MSLVGHISKEQRAALDRISKDQKNTERLNKQKLDKDAYFRLMLEQLRHQDPTAPMDNNAMLAQMSQFSTMEQLGNMVKMQEKMTAATEGLGKQIKEMVEKIGGKTDQAEILEELKKMNRLLEAYLPKSNKKQDVSGVLESGVASGADGKGGQSGE